MRIVEAWQAARSFAATAAHELRTPLTGIQTALDVLEHPGAKDGDRREALGDLREAHTRVLGLLEVLRALSRAELARPEQFTEVDLAELTETALHAARGRHPGVRFDAQGNVPAGDPAAASLLSWADGVRMVLDNLLDNAAVHGAGPIALGLWREPGFLVLTVDDQGPGIADELRGRLFDRFVSAEGSPGFGLGLTIVAQVVALHQGTVEAGPGPTGRGTRFVVRLPSQGFPKERF
jgi:two-component system sensor histidine kinase PrrB